MPEPVEFMPVPPLLPTLRDRSAMLVLCAITGALLGWTAAMLLPATQTATATVRVGPGVVNLADAAAAQGSSAEATGLAMLRPQLQRLADRLGDNTSIQELRSKLTVAAQPETALVDFTATASEAREAELIADEAAKVYLESARELADAQLARQFRALDSETKPARGTKPGAAAAALATLVVDPGAVVAPAEGTSKPNGLPRWAFPPLGAVVGLLLAAALAHLLETLNPRVRRGVRLHVGAPYLGRVSRRAHPEQIEASLVPAALAAERGRVVVAEVGRPAREVADLVRSALGHRGGRVGQVDLHTATGLRTAAKSAGVVLLAREKVTRVDDVRAAVQRLHELGAPVLGILSSAGVRTRASRKQRS